MNWSLEFDVLNSTLIIYIYIKNVYKVNISYQLIMNEL